VFHFAFLQKNKAVVIGYYDVLASFGIFFDLLAFNEFFKFIRRPFAFYKTYQFFEKRTVILINKKIRRAFNIYTAVPVFLNGGYVSFCQVKRNASVEKIFKGSAVLYFFAVWVGGEIGEIFVERVGCVG